MVIIQRLKPRSRIVLPIHLELSRIDCLVFLFWERGGGALVGFSIPVFVGAVTGFCIGGVVKLAKMVIGHESNAHTYGAFIGGTVGALLGLPAAVVCSAIGVVAGLIAGTAGNLVMLPVDIYRAATLPENQLNPWKLQVQQIKEETTVAFKEAFQSHVK